MPPPTGPGRPDAFTPLLRAQAHRLEHGGMSELATTSGAPRNFLARDLARLDKSVDACGGESEAVGAHTLADAWTIGIMLAAVG